jgi:hypothetical protein
MSKKPDDSKDKQIAALKAQLRQLEQTRGEQVSELMQQLETAMSDIAELLVRCEGYKIKVGQDD